VCPLGFFFLALIHGVGAGDGGGLGGEEETPMLLMISLDSFKSSSILSQSIF
jgi:hypothetical protein